MKYFLMRTDQNYSSYQNNNTQGNGNKQRVYPPIAVSTSYVHSLIDLEEVPTTYTQSNQDQDRNISPYREATISMPTPIREVQNFAYPTPTINYQSNHSSYDGQNMNNNNYQNSYYLSSPQQAIYNTTHNNYSSGNNGFNHHYNQLPNNGYSSMLQPSTSQTYTPQFNYGTYPMTQSPPPMNSNIHRNNASHYQYNGTYYYQSTNQHYQPSAQHTQQQGSINRFGDVTVNPPKIKSRRKALLIGINYFFQKGELKGCINDVNNVKKFIMKYYGYQRENMLILTDDQEDLIFIPNKENIIQAMFWLVKDAKPGDHLFFHFSGHGGQTKCLDGDEEDGLKETILPLDHEYAGQIVDDDMNAILAKPLMEGVKLTVIFDSCYSGTALDLPYVYDHKGKVKNFSRTKTVFQTLNNSFSELFSGRLKEFSKIIKSGSRSFSNGKRAEMITRRTRSTQANITMFASCKVEQVSIGFSLQGKSTGTMSFALIYCLSRHPYTYTYLELLNDLRLFLEETFQQKLVFSSGFIMNTNTVFTL